MKTNVYVDAYQNDYEVAVIISNDSDLVEPIKIIREQLGKRVGILNPHAHHPSRELLKNADFFKTIREGVIKVSQFPKALKDAVGVFHKPELWDRTK